MGNILVNSYIFHKLLEKEKDNRELLKENHKKSKENYEKSKKNKSIRNRNTNDKCSQEKIVFY